MPSKVGKRSRKGKMGKRVGSSSQHADTAPQPPSHSLIDYRKFDQIDTTDSDEDSPGSTFMPPTFDDNVLGDNCTCPQCLARREAEAEGHAGRAASGTNRHSSSHAAPQHAHSQLPGGFNFSKALGNASKARGAEGKSGSKHDPPVFTIEGSGGDHASWMAAIDQAASGAGLTRNSTQVIPGPNAVPGKKEGSYSPHVQAKQTYRAFIQKFLTDYNYPPMVVCNVLERFEGSTQSGEQPATAVHRILHELSIPIDPVELDLASVQESLKAPKIWETGPKPAKKKQGSPSSRQRQMHPESKPPNGMAADPVAFKAALAKYGFQTINMRPATEADRTFMETGIPQNNLHDPGDSDATPTSDDDYSDDDDDLDELPDLVDMKQQPGDFKPSGNVFQPPAAAAASKQANGKSASAKPPAAKPPAAKPPAAKPPAAKPPASKPPVSKPSATTAAAAPTAGKSSTKAQASAKPAQPAAKQAPAKSTPQRVDTISDDDSDDMPDLASASDSDSDNGDMPSTVDSEEMPDLVDSDGSDESDDESHLRQPPPAKPAAKPAGTPAAKPAAAQAAKASTQPAAAQATEPATKPAAAQATKPATKPAAAQAAKPAAASNVKQSKEDTGRPQSQPPAFQFGANSNSKPVNPSFVDRPAYRSYAEAPDTESNGKQLPSESAAKGTAAPEAASQEGEPMFRPVSRGALAQYSTLLSSHTPSHDVDTDRLASSSSSAARDSSPAGTGFSFDRPNAGKAAAKQPGPSSSAQSVDDSDKGVQFMREPTVRDIKNIVRTTGARSAWSIAEEAKRAQMEGRATFIKRYEEETPQQRAAKQRAADAAMQKLLEEEEQEKAEAAARADKAKKEKQKSKKAKQKAKKKAQQEKDAKRSGSNAAQKPPPTCPSLNPPPESSASDSDEEEEPFSLHDSRFGSLLADTTPAAESEGSGGVQQESVPDPKPKEGGQAEPMQGGVSRSIFVNAAPSSAAESDHDSNEDSLMRQLGGAYKHLPKMGGAGPSSEKSYSSQDTQGSSQQAGAVPVLKPGQSPLQWSQARPQAQQPVPTSAAASSLANGHLQQHQQQQASYSVRSGLLPGAPLPSPAGVALPLPGMGPPTQTPNGIGQPPLRSSAQETDPHLAQVLKACRQVLQEMDAARGAGEKGRLQQAIKAGVAWLSQNASNPDVSDSSRQVRSKLLDARAAMKQFATRGSAPAAAPPAAAVNQPISQAVSQGPISQRPLAPAASPLLPADLAPPAPITAAAEASRVPSASDTGRSSPVSQVRQTAEQWQNMRPYQQSYRPPASEAMPASHTDAFRLFHGQQGSSSTASHQQPYAPNAPALEQGSSGKGPHQQPFAPNGPALEPFRYPQRGALGRGGPPGGRGLGQQPSPGGRGPYQQHVPGRGFGGSQPPPPQESYSAYRQRQAQPRPPLQPPGAMPVPPRLSVSSQAGSEHGSLDRSTLSGSEATSPVKSSQGQQQRYVQPTPFGVPERPSFQDDYDDDDCVVCMDDVKCTIFVPCGHSLCCRTCAAKVTQTRARCPLCDIPTDGFCETQPSATAQHGRQQQTAVAY